LPSTTTQTTIANRALQLLGYKRISSINDNDRGAIAINRAYLPVLYNMLRQNYWGFSIKRASLAASATPPTFGPANYYPLPADFLDLAPMDPTFGVNSGGPLTGPPSSVDWQIEGGQIASNQQSPIQIRYVSSNITESMFDSIFAEAFAAALAMNTCEELTQSNTKIATAKGVYEDMMEIAKQRNAFESRPMQAPVSLWTSARF